MDDCRLHDIRAKVALNSGVTEKDLCYYILYGTTDEVEALFKRLQ